MAKFLSKLEKNNIVLEPGLIESLMSLSKSDLKEMIEKCKTITKSVKGQFLRSSFATSDDIENEQITTAELYAQFYMYYNTYFLGRVPTELFELNRVIDVVDNKEIVQNLNNTFKICVERSVCSA
jgi:hypothetical protein